MVIVMKKKKIKKSKIEEELEQFLTPDEKELGDVVEIEENKNPEDITVHTITINKVCDPKDAILDTLVTETIMLQTKDVGGN